MAKRINMRAVMVLLLVFCTVVAMMPAGAWAAAADEKMCFYGGGITAAPGEIVEFPVFVKNNQGMSSTIIYLNSSSEQNISAVRSSDGKSPKASEGSVFSSGSMITNTVEEGYLVLWYAASNNKKNGELFKMQFKVADNAREGTYRISVTYSQADTANVKGELLDVVTEAGTITVKGAPVSGGESGSGSEGGTVVPGGSVTPPAGSGSGESAVPDDSDAEEDADDKDQKAFISDVKATELKLSSKLTRLNGKRAIKLTWKLAGDGEIEVGDLDGYCVHRSTKKSSGYGVKPYYTTKKLSYTNSKSLKKGKTYYFKVRGYVEIDGKKYYTKWSNKAWRTIK